MLCCREGLTGAQAESVLRIEDKEMCFVVCVHRNLRFLCSLVFRCVYVWHRWKDFSGITV